jgi:hypothetical protein
MNLKNRNLSFPKAAFINVLLLLFASTLHAQSPSDESRAGQWRIAGQNLSNTWSQPAEHSISPSNVKRLKANGSSQLVAMFRHPTVAGDAVYFPGGPATSSPLINTVVVSCGLTRSPTTTAFPVLFLVLVLR